MKESEILNLAIENYELTKISLNAAKAKDGPNSSFGEIKKMLKSIYNSKDTEEEKKKQINKFIEYVENNKSNRIFNVKSDVFKIVFKSCFSQKIKNNLNDNVMTIYDLYYYSGIMERIFKSKMEISYIKDTLTKQNEIIFNLEKENNKRLEEENKKKLEEEEKKLKEQEERIKQEKAKKQANMNVGEIVLDELDEIPDEEKEAYITTVISEIANKTENDKILIAKCLKEYYIKINVWNGKPSKKVKKKIDTLKSILGE